VKTNAVRGIQLVYRNLPLSIVISVSSITVLYVLVNFTYFVVLGIDGVLQSEAVAVVRLVTSLSILNIIIRFNGRRLIGIQNVRQRRLSYAS